MVRHQEKGTLYYTFPSLGVKHAIFTRLGGVSQPPFEGLNVGHLVGDNMEAVEANHRLIYETLGFAAEDVVTARQVHGHSVAVVGLSDRGKVIPATDGLLTRAPGLALMLRFADCLPILLYDPERKAIALGHAGWRGTAERLAYCLAEAMKEEFGCRSQQIVAGLGPAIGPCCYQVGPEVAEAISQAMPECKGALVERSDGVYLDLWEANRWQLQEAGVERIEMSNICTACHTREFFSHRAQKRQTGRFAALMAL